MLSLIFTLVCMSASVLVPKRPRLLCLFVSFHHVKILIDYLVIVLMEFYIHAFVCACYEMASFVAEI